MQTAIFLIAILFGGALPIRAQTIVDRANDKQAELEVTVILSGACDKLCDSDLLVRKVLRNSTGRDLAPGTTVRIRIASWITLPKDSFVATLERAGDDWVVSPKQLCSLEGGSFERHGKGGFRVCIHKFPDGGRDCTDHSQCRGACLYERTEGKTPKPGEAVKGKCQRDSNPYGCRTGVHDGKISDTICRD